MGIDIHKIKAMHVYGPKFTQSIVTTSRDLLSPAGERVSVPVRQ